jgi:hypothetical protein
VSVVDATPEEPGDAQAKAAGAILPNPYVGPRPFERNEEHLFFGRDREARDLISLIIANRVFVLYSQSGAGKSSLLNTKVMAGLESEGCRVLPIARVQGKMPAGIAESAIKNIFSLNAISSLRDEASRLDSDALAGFSIARFIGAIQDADDDEPIVLIFDQFEELFSFYEYRWGERATFLREIIDALAEFSELKVVFALREDYIAKLDAYANEFPNRLRSRYHLERLQKPAALDAVRLPAENGGRRYDDGVAQAIVDDLLETRSLDIRGQPVTVAGEYIEPVQLQVICSNLWESIPKGETLITREHLKSSGRVDEVLGKFYDSALAKIASKTGVPELDIRRWVESALVTSAGTRGTVFRAALSS